MRVSNHAHGLVCIVVCMPPLQVVVLLCTLQCFTDYNSKVSLFQAQDVWKQVQSSGDAPGEKCQLLHYCTFQVTV